MLNAIHYSLGKYKLQQWDSTTHLLKWPMRMQSYWNSHALPMGMQNNTVALENSLAVSNKNKTSKINLFMT